jgi:hypothetical protein
MDPQDEPINWDITTTSKAAPPDGSVVASKASPKVKKFSCIKCDIEFKTWLMFKKHVKSEYHKNMNRRFRCPFCVENVGFPCAKILRKHIAQHHTKTICIFCKKILKGERSLHQHVKLKHVAKNDDKSVAKLMANVAGFSVAKSAGGVGDAAACSKSGSTSNVSNSQSDLGSCSVAMKNAQNDPLNRDSSDIPTPGGEKDAGAENEPDDKGADFPPKSGSVGVNIAESSQFCDPTLSHTSADRIEKGMQDSAQSASNKSAIDQLAAVGLTPVSSQNASGLKRTKSGIVLDDDMPLNVFMQQVYKPGRDKWWWRKNEQNIVSWVKKTRRSGQRSKLDYSKLSRGLIDYELMCQKRSRKRLKMETEKRSQKVTSAGKGGKGFGDAEATVSKKTKSNQKGGKKAASKNKMVLSDLMTCPVCDKQCSQNEFPRHHKNHFKGNGWHCVHCKITVKGDFLSHLGVHLKDSRNKSGYFGCKRCGFVTDKNAIFELHMRDHVISSQFCSTCKKAVTGDYIAHIKQHRLRNSATIWKCQKCHESFETKKALEKHLLSHVELERELNGCPLCPKTFDDFVSYSDHLRSHADRITVHICFLCDAVCFSEEELIGHVRIHVNADKICENCGVIFTCGDKHAIRQHKCVEVLC